MILHHTRADREYNLYLVISQTPTKFGSVIRRFAGLTYNHASLAFEADLKHLYSFGRYQHKNPLNAGLIREYPDRFTLKRHARINVRIYKLPVTKEQYTLGKGRILEIKHDPEGYLYNLFSVLTYPVLKGFHTYKAYSCAEFTAHMLLHMGLLSDQYKRSCEYTPEELGGSFKDLLYFEGNLLDYWTDAPEVQHDFFGSPGHRKTVKTNCVLPARLLYRKLRFGNKYAAVN